MAFVWVQQWIALPVVVEDQMGDAPSQSAMAAVPPDHGHADKTATAATSNTTTTTTNTAMVAPPQVGSPDPRSPSGNAPFFSQFNSLPPLQQRLDLPHHQHSHPGAYAVSPSHQQAPTPLNLSSLAGALPDIAATSQHPQAQRGVPGATSPAVMFPLPQMTQISARSAMSLHNNPYNTGLAHAQYAPGYPAQVAQPMGYPSYPTQHRSAGPGPMQQSYVNYSQPGQPILYYPAQYQGQLSSYAPQPAQQPAIYPRRASVPTASVSVVAPVLNPPLPVGSYPAVNPLIPPGESQIAGGYSGPTNLQGFSRHGSDASSLGSVPRGPPRKPRQSGHALWVGNLPPGTTITDLKDHFSRDATKEIESLFLISKSNCAFVNYRTEESCTAAMQRFHDSRFHGVRLVCRLRRSSAPASGVPTAPSAMTGPRITNPSPDRPPSVQAEETPKNAEQEPEVPSKDGVDGAEQAIAGSTRVSEKFFVVKSLTLQDLELSVRTGIWATQSHNEEALNKAYATADNVYLIFSANKSGEYFGYARMTSPISADATEIMTALPKGETQGTADAPKTIPTPATEFAPKGRIIDDSARGTIFWEADPTDEEDNGDKSGKESSQLTDGEVPAGTQTWGKPFKIEWISTNRLPFYRTRGLRNPWNANREVKIARDGTELETSVGKRLVQMFHRVPPTVTVPPPNVPLMAMPPHPMRPF